MRFVVKGSCPVATGHERRAVDRFHPGPFGRNVARSPLGFFAFLPEQSPELCLEHMLVYKEGFTRMSNEQHCNVAGIDVSKANLDFAISGQVKARCVTYNDAGLAMLIEACVEAEVGLVVFEATGGLERRLRRFLNTAGLPCHMANPRQVRDLARAMGRLAKTDAIDARVLVDYGEKLRPTPTVLPSKNRDKLCAMVARYRQLDAQRTAERNRRSRCDDDVVVAMIEQMLELIETQIKCVRQEMNAVVNADEAMRRDVKQLASMPGIGELTAQRLVAQLPELGRCTGGQIAKLVGVAPVNRDSGTMRGKRTTGGGRCELRKSLYMPTLVAVRRNPMIQAMYERLVEGGKPKKVALIACMRKLLIYLNAMIRDKKTWEEFIEIA